MERGSGENDGSNKKSFMKIILINPPFNIAKENYDSSISVGLLSVATFLDANGVAVEIVDGARQKNYLDLIKEKTILEIEK